MERENLYIERYLYSAGTMPVLGRLLRSAFLRLRLGYDLAIKPLNGKPDRAERELDESGSVADVRSVLAAGCGLGWVSW